MYEDPAVFGAPNKTARPRTKTIALTGGITAVVAVIATVLAVSAPGGSAHSAVPPAAPSIHSAALPSSAADTGAPAPAVLAKHATTRHPSGRTAGATTTRPASIPVPPPPRAAPTSIQPPPRRSQPPSSAPSPSTQLTEAATAVFNAINSARTRAGLPALRVDARLVSSAHSHNQAMARSNALSHQEPGEPDFGQRESDAGVRWNHAEENIGFNTDCSGNGVPGAMVMHQQMMNEGPPPPGATNHYSNIMSAQVNFVGIDVYYDATNGKIWLTEDFAGE